MPAKAPARMTPEERAAKVDALKPAWAKDYIRQLESLTRTLHAQLRAAQAQAVTGEDASQYQDRGLPQDWDNPPYEYQVTAPARAECTLHQPLPVPGCAACETLSLAEWKDRYARHSQQRADTQLVQPDGSVVSTSVIPGITPPSGDWTVVRVLDGAANMEPLADLPHKAEIRFAGSYQVHYGAHESTGGARVLIVETDAAMQVRPVSPNEVLIVAMGG